MLFQVPLEHFVSSSRTPSGHNMPLAHRGGGGEAGRRSRKRQGESERAQRAHRGRRWENNIRLPPALSHRSGCQQLSEASEERIAQITPVAGSKNNSTAGACGERGGVWDGGREPPKSRALRVIPLLFS
ncbi:hypothetical protein AAFF_G00333170 [Aldrovandia affinis]|uniref:Uncharacterized protein n=1 Tax=Aldrovandia affinis TaxID=143900 RepID=A0AAD7SLN4_9TELE|nr:hypothetical protein AAFF_G00333170 [Aldrovandia affinis]